MNRFFRRVNRRKYTSIPSRLLNIANIGVNLEKAEGTSLSITRKQLYKMTKDEMAAYDQMVADDDLDINDYTPYYDRAYKEKRKILRRYSEYPELEYILETVTNEAIDYRDNGTFCELKINSSVDIKDTVKENVNFWYKSIYRMLNFHDGSYAWGLFFRWKVEGYLSFEYIWDDINNPKEIVRIEEIDPATLYTDTLYDDNGDERKVWIQEIETGYHIKTRVIPFNSIVMISYNRVSSGYNKISYLERLIRSFNMLRSTENAKVAWVIMHSRYKMKYVIPMGKRSTAAAKSSLATLKNKYKESLVIDSQSGETYINGESKFPYKNDIFLPERNGESPTIEAIKHDGTDLDDMDIPRYFDRKLQRDSNLPFSRFDREDGAGSTYVFNADIPYDELSFFKFKNRLTKEFSKCIIHGLKLMIEANMPELSEDTDLMYGISVKHYSINDVSLAKQYEEIRQKFDYFETMQGLAYQGTGQPIYPDSYLLKEIFGYTDEQLSEWKEQVKKEQEDDLNENSKLDNRIRKVLMGIIKEIQQ